MMVVLVRSKKRNNCVCKEIQEAFGIDDWKAMPLCEAANGHIEFRIPGRGSVLTSQPSTTNKGEV